MTDGEKKLIHPLFQRLQGRVIVAGNHVLDGDLARLEATLREAAQLLDELRAVLCGGRHDSPHA